MAYFGVIFFANIGGGGGQNYVQLFTLRKRSPAKGVWQKSDEKSDRSVSWSAANRGLRDGGLSKAEEICGKRPFSSVFWISQVSSHPPEKGEKGRKRAKKADFWEGRPDTP